MNTSHILKYADIEQRTPEWYDLRCGKITGSRMSDVMAKGRGNNPSATRETYKGEIFAERMSGVSVDTGGFVSAAMQHGIDNEEAAIGTYEIMNDVEVTRVAFVDHPHIKYAGCSPDGVIIQGKGGVEVKCMHTKNHFNCWLNQQVPPEHIKQIQWNIACCDADWWDFVSYDPRLPADMNMEVIRVPRDGHMIRDLEDEAMVFIGEVEDMIKTATEEIKRRAA